MFREMRRKRQALSERECVEILRCGTSGVLALSGDGGYPYALPISYVYDDGKLYFHCARTGHKLDAVRRDRRASFCVIGRDQLAPEAYTTYFRSVIVFGTMRILDSDAQKRDAIEKLAVKYAPEASERERQQEIDREWSALCMLEMTIQHMTGKEAIELTRERSSGDGAPERSAQ